VFRRGEAAGNVDILREAGDRLADHWLRVSRFREVEALTTRSLRFQSSPGTLVRAGRAAEMTGNLTAALDHLQQALSNFREISDRAGEATTLNSIGMVHAGWGDRQAALDYFEQALPIMREVRDRASEAATLTNIGLVHARWGDGSAALDHYKQALLIRREVGDRTGEGITLNNIGAVYDNWGDGPAASTTMSRRCSFAGR
jgi:tetratricopeptide (TPR) repeat protein